MFEDVCMKSRTAWYFAHTIHVIFSLFRTLWNSVLTIALPNYMELSRSGKDTKHTWTWRWTYNGGIEIFDVLCSVLFGNTTPTEIHHLDPKNLSSCHFCHWWYVRVPSVVKRKLLFPWLLLHVYRHNQSRSIKCHYSASLRVSMFWSLLNAIGKVKVKLDARFFVVDKIIWNIQNSY